MAAKKILIALTNHATLGNTGKPTGFWLSELTHPFFVFQRGGFGIDLISPKGALPPPHPSFPPPPLLPFPPPPHGKGRAAPSEGRGLRTAGYRAKSRLRESDRRKGPRAIAPIVSG